jgi:hypothetical protein
VREASTQEAAPAGHDEAPGGKRRAEVAIAGVALVLDCDGALYWPDAGLLAISDLHLEKGSSFAARGVLLPPTTPRRRWRGLLPSLLATRRRR